MTENSKSDLVAELQLYAPEFGGRQQPTPDLVFRCLLEFEGEKFNAALLLTETGPLLPGGGTKRIPIMLLHPDLLISRLKLGSRFTLWEGRTIGEGVVLELS